MNLNLFFVLITLPLLDFLKRMYSNALGRGHDETSGLVVTTILVMALIDSMLQ